MKYKVTIETEDEVTETKQEWVQLWNDAILRERELEWQKTAEATRMLRLEREEKGPQQYGYRDRVITSTKRVTVLEQTLSELKLVDVIKAINGIT